jgi:hypothetical protein
MKTATDVVNERDEAARERERVRQEASERAQKESRLSSEERAKQANEKSAEIRQERLSATNILNSGTANIQLATIASQGGPVGRKLEREIRQFQQTGRVSSWLAGETIKAEAAQNAAQQSAFRQAVVDVIQSTPSSSFDISPARPSFQLITRKPEIPEEAAETCIGLALYVKNGNVWIGAGTVAGQLPSGFDPTEGKVIASDGSGYVAALVTVNNATGSINSIQINGGYSDFPYEDPSTGEYYYVLGYYEYDGNTPTVTNYGCGSLEAKVCRRYFVSDDFGPYSVSLTRF